MYYRGGLLINKINQLTGRIASKLLKVKGLKEINPSQGRILLALKRKDGIPINQLAKELSLGKSTLTSMLDRMEEAGYIKRIPSKEDKREINIYLKEEYFSLTDEYQVIVREMSQLYYKGFSEKEILEFENYLNRVYENLLNNHLEEKGK